MTPTLEEIRKVAIKCWFKHIAWDRVTHYHADESQLQAFAQHFKEEGRKEQQAKIDRLMLEYCPDEMTEQQRVDWANSQRPVTIRNNTGE